MVLCWFSSGQRRLRRDLERAQLARVNLENVRLQEIAAIAETNLVHQGVHCRVLVDNAIATRSLPHFLVGDANGLFWLHGVADVYECSFLICDKDTVLFRRKWVDQAGKQMAPERQ